MSVVLYPSKPSSQSTQALDTTTNPVNVSEALAPIAGKLLTAVDATHATWQAAAAGYSDAQAIAAVVALLVDGQLARRNGASLNSVAYGDIISHGAAEFQPIDADLTAIAALATQAYGRGLLTLADLAALYTALAVDIDGALAANSDVKLASQKATKTYADLKLAKASNLSDLANAATARTNLGLAIGTNVQAWDADLDYLASFTPTANVKSVLNAADYAAIKTLLALVVGTNVQAWDADLDALAALASTAALVRRTGAGTFGLVVPNADGVTSGTVGTPLDSTDIRGIYGAAFAYRCGYCIGPGNTSTTLYPVGSTYAVNGTATFPGDATAYYTKYTSAASTNAAFGWWLGGPGTSGLFQADQGIYIRFVVKTGTSLANIRLFFGCTFSNDTTVANSAQQALLRYCTDAAAAPNGAPDAGWSMVTKDGTTQSLATVADAIATSTRYVIDMWLTLSAFTVVINGGTPTVKTTNLPQTKIQMNIICSGSNVDASAHTLSIDRVAWTTTS